MNKLISLAGMILLIFSCQRVDTEKNAERVYIFNNSDSIKHQIENVENSLLPAIFVKRSENVKYNIYDRMEDYQVPAVSIAVIDDYKVIWAKAYGVTKTGITDSISISTMFQAASLSKPITSIVTMHLSKKGVIDIDKAINSQMSNWKIPENNFTIENSITPRMILLHTSGLNIPGFPGYSINDTIPRVLDILNGQEPSITEKIIPQFVPNTKWSYSGGGYVVLQFLLEERTGKNFQQLMQANLFDQLNIRNSTFEQPLRKHPASYRLSDN
jgi:CubicO group peptidase (beta-lactamase class C family)